MPETNLTVDTLENLCLCAIVDKLDCFSTAFQSEDCNNFEGYLEFLQKCYSDKIFQLLVKRSLMKDKYFYIVINKYTRKLDFRDIVHCKFQAILESLEKFGSVIQKFDMVSIKPFYCYDDVWKYLPNVQFIDLQYTNCSDETIIRIADNCPHLKSLNLGYCLKISDKGLIYLSKKCPPLEFLNLMNTTATVKGVACVLKKISSIKTLWFDNVPRAIFEALEMNDIVKLPSNVTFNLTNITIINKPMRPEAHLTTTLKLCQSLCPFIEDLTVTEILNDEQVKLCSLFKSLKKVNLQCSLSLSISLDINDFLKITGENIHTLVLMNFSLSLPVLVNSCPNLKTLTLEYPVFEKFKATHSFNSFSNLKCFNLHNTILRAEEGNIESIAAIIALSPNIEEINFRVCENLDEIYETLLKYPSQLRVLSFGTSVVEASFLEEILTTHKSLIEVHLDNSGITVEEYDDLMDIVDEMERQVTIGWTDYHLAIRELYSTDYILSRNRQILKL